MALKLFTEPVVFRYNLEKNEKYFKELLSPKLGLKYYIDNETIVTMTQKP